MVLFFILVVGPSNSNAILYDYQELLDYGIDQRDLSILLPVPRNFMFFTYLPKYDPGGCIYTLQTNYILESECVLPRRCGQPFFNKLTSSWYGTEVGICYGVGNDLPYFIDNNSSNLNIDNIYLPDDWFAVFDSTLPKIRDQDFEFNTNDGTCRTTISSHVIDGLAIAYLYGNKHVHVASYAIIPHIIQYFHINKRLLDLDQREVNGKYCSTRFTTIGQITQFSLGKDYYPFVFDGTLPYPQKYCQSSFKPHRPPLYPMSNNVCWDKLSQDTVSCSPNYPATCSPYKWTNSYSIPGSKFLFQIIETIIDYIIELLNYIFINFFLLLKDTIIDLNSTYRLVEFILSYLVLLKYFKSINSLIFCLILLTFTIGITR